MMAMASDKKPVIKPQQGRLMLTLSRLVLATPWQLNRALYARGSRTTTEALLFSLYSARYLERLSWRRHDRGNPKVVYKLATKGMKYVKSHAPVGERMIRPSDNLTHTRYQLSHLLHANDLIVHAIELARTAPTILLDDYLTEPYLRRQPLIVSSGLEEKALVADGWVKLHKVHPHPRPPGERVFAFELDRATTDLERVKDKYQAWILADGSEEYSDYFGTNTLQVIWVVDEGNTRHRDKLAQACWDHLRATHQEDRSDLFLFGVSDDNTVAEDFFFNPQRFVEPSEGGGKRTSLLPQGWKGHMRP